MRIAAITAQTLAWPIASAGAARGRTERSAVVIEVRSAAGGVGLGEASPLPGMSRDSLADAERAIAAIAAQAPFEIGEAIAESPSARFALETAVLDLAARERRVSLAALIAPSPAQSVPLAAVVDDPEAARRAVALGIRWLKIKLTADDDPARVFAIAAAAPTARLRIDANRSWPRAEVADRLAELAALPIDYVEEPCRDAHQLLASQLALPLALDESLAWLAADELDAALASRQLAALVLKPGLLGGLTTTARLAERARRAGCAAIASHGLEGPIGTAACAELALALGGEHPVGLGPHTALAGWRIGVAQLAADRVQRATPPGLGFVDLDLAGAVAACPAA